MAPKFQWLLGRFLHWDKVKAEFLESSEEFIHLLSTSGTVRMLVGMSNSYHTMLMVRNGNSFYQMPLRDFKTLCDFPTMDQALAFLRTNWRVTEEPRLGDAVRTHRDRVEYHAWGFCEWKRIHWHARVSSQPAPVSRQFVEVGLLSWHILSAEKTTIRIDQHGKVLCEGEYPERLGKAPLTREEVRGLLATLGARRQAVNGVWPAPEIWTALDSPPVAQ